LWQTTPPFRSCIGIERQGERVKTPTEDKGKEWWEEKGRKGKGMALVNGENNAE